MQKMRYATNLHAAGRPRKLHGSFFLAALFFVGCAGVKSMPDSKGSHAPPKTPPLPAQRVEPSGDAETRLRKAAEAAGVAFPLTSPHIRIFKHDRRLELWSEGKLVTSFGTALGADPELDKVRQGDHRTPVGEFYVCTRNDLSKFHLFLGLSYPNTEDAERGLRDKLISAAEYRQILAANRSKTRPLWNTGLGGEVGIHGGGTGQDWTWGCIALENSAIEELWLACPLKTPVSIQL